MSKNTETRLAGVATKLSGSKDGRESITPEVAIIFENKDIGSLFHARLNYAQL